MSRPRRAGLLRNAAIVLGNLGDSSAVPALLKALHDSEALIRGAAAWALGNLGDETVFALLNQRLAVEVELDVIQELKQAMTEIKNRSE